MINFLTRFVSSLASVIAVLSVATADDWRTLGRDSTHNAVSRERGAPIEFRLMEDRAGVAWTAPLGRNTLASPVVADGLVWITSHVIEPADDSTPPKDWDGGLIMCFRERDGKLLWQHRSPRLTAGYEQDMSYGAIGSVPLVEGNRLWYVNNRCEAVCFDITPLKNGTGNPREMWKLDMPKELNVYPRTLVMLGGGGASVASYQDKLYVVTHNGISWDPQGPVIPSPKAPSLVCLEKATGKVVWQDNSPGKDILHVQLSSPLVCEVGGRAQVIVGQGDGWLRSFDPATGKLLWKCDLNAKDSEYDSGIGARNYVMATPVLYDGRIYIATGQDVEHTDGVGALYCMDPTKNGDVSRELEAAPKKGKPNPNSAVVWYTPPTVPDDAPRILTKNKKGKDVDRLRDYRDFYFGRVIANITANDGLLYAADLGGYIYCFDAKTGKLHWYDDTKSSIWGQPLWVDGKVYFSNDSSDILIYAHGREKKLLAKIEAEHTVRAGLVYANGTLYIPSQGKLYAVRAAPEVNDDATTSCPAAVVDRGSAWRSRRLAPVARPGPFQRLFGLRPDR